MRDPKRIDEFCAELARLWHEYPDFRFGQMFSNVCSCNNVSDPFYIEDDEMLNMFKKYFGEEQECYDEPQAEEICDYQRTNVRFSKA